jgi:hypothetical protein
MALRLRLLANMISKNVLNHEKKDSIIGNVFHLYYYSLSEAVLYDVDMVNPIIYGSKAIVLTNLKNIYKLMNVPITSNVVIVSYIQSIEGYKKIDLYKGPIEKIGKYIRRY